MGLLLAHLGGVSYGRPLPGLHQWTYGGIIVRHRFDDPFRHIW